MNLVRAAASWERSPLKLGYGAGEPLSPVKVCGPITRRKVESGSVVGSQPKLIFWSAYCWKAAAIVDGDRSYSDVSKVGVDV